MHSGPTVLARWAVAATLAAGSIAQAQPAAAPPAPGAAVPSPDVQRQGSAVVNKLIAAIRYNKDEVAAKQLGFAHMTQALMGPQVWSQLSTEQQAQASASVAVLVRQASFSRGREVYGYIDAVRFSASQARQEGERLLLPSTVVVHRDLKKTEMAVTWVLQREQGTLRIVDTLTAGDSLCAGIHEDEVVPLLRKGGPAAVLEALQARASKASPAHKAGS